jgi:TldD protein
MSNRRDFIRDSGIVLGVLAAANACRASAPPATPTPTPSPSGASPTSTDASVKELMMEALNAAKLAGASYADARIGRYRNNFVITREQQIVQVVDTDSMGVGVRALVDGTWGFAATRQLTRDRVAGAAREAVAIAKANRVARDRSVELAPAPAVPNGTWRSAYQVDPWTIPIEQKADLLLKANAEGLKVDKVKYVFSAMYFVKEDRSFASTDGTVTTQTIIRSWVPMQFTAVAPDFSDFQNRGNVVQPAGRGYEFVLAQNLAGNAGKWAEEAAQKLTAKPVGVGRYDLVLHPSHLWLTIHESIGHPTELDRAMGYEANYAGTSFVAPVDKFLGQFRYGPEFMNIQGDRSQEGACATIGWDDEGVAPDDFLIIRNGVFNDYQTTREQANWLRSWYQSQGRPVRSHGCSNADSWSSVQFQRMPNVSLLPGEQERSFEDIIAATDRGLALVGDSSYSIDQQRYNAQFSGQTP